MLSKKNVLFICCDQLRCDALGIYGNKVVKTPNIDRLFGEGVKFTNMFAAHAVCAPNRGAIATGRWPKVNGLVFNAYVLPQEETTMMDVFRLHGYSTYGIGKMHFSPQWLNDWDSNGRGAVSPQPEPWQFPWLGFEHCSLTEDNRIGPYADYLKANGFDEWDDLHSFSMGKQHCTQASPYPEEHHQTTWITDRSIDFLKSRDKSKPFFMWTSYVDPHHPFNPPAPFDTMYAPEDMPPPIYKEGEHDKRSELFARYATGANMGHCTYDGESMTDRDWQRIKAYYYGMISLIDKNVGRLVDYLKEIGEYDNTIFVFTSDHGEMLGDHHLLYKPTPFDCVTRVPFLIVGAGVDSKDVDVLCRSLEIMPTILDAAGLVKPEFMNGISLIDHLQQSDVEPPFDNIVIENIDYHTLRDKKYRLSIYHQYSQGELYDLENDPENFNNLWNDEAYKEIKESMTSCLVRKIYNEMVDPKFQKVGMC